MLLICFTVIDRLENLKMSGEMTDNILNLDLIDVGVDIK